MKEALLYDKTGDGVTCRLCAHRCRLKDGKTGICGVRKNSGGILYALSYDKVCATHADPIEKKPLYHFLPGSVSFSMATVGCNLNCKFCQNHSLSMVRGEESIHGDPLTPAQLVDAAIRCGADSIAYTYSEPTIYFELMLDTATLAKAANIKNVMVTNGFMSPEALAMIAPVMDAANIDLKAFTDSFYKKQCGGALAPVLETIRGMYDRGIWIELTTLLIPGLNSDEGEIKELIAFILSIDQSIPWHVSRFFPQHRLLDAPPTSAQSMFNALEMGRDMGLEYMYAGNVVENEFSHTYCPSCRALLIERSGYYTQVKKLTGGKCGKCNHEIAGIFK